MAVETKDSTWIIFWEFSGDFLGFFSVFLFLSTLNPFGGRSEREMVDAFVEF